MLRPRVETQFTNGGVYQGIRNLPVLSGGVGATGKDKEGRPVVAKYVRHYLLSHSGTCSTISVCSNYCLTMVAGYPSLLLVLFFHGPSHVVDRHMSLQDGQQFQESCGSLLVALDSPNILLDSFQQNGGFVMLCQPRSHL